MIGEIISGIQPPSLRVFGGEGRSIRVPLLGAWLFNTPSQEVLTAALLGSRTYFAHEDAKILRTHSPGSHCHSPAGRGGTRDGLVILNCHQTWKTLLDFFG